MKIINFDHDSITFDNGTIISANHKYDCCEHHYLEFEHLKKEDITSLTFTPTKSGFPEINLIEDYGIELIPNNDHPLRIPGYGHNNGYYSSNLSLIMENKEGFKTTTDISKCQDIDWA